MSTKNVNKMQNNVINLRGFLAAHGINFSWFARQLGISRQAMERRLDKNRICPRTTQILRRLCKDCVAVVEKFD